MRAILLALFLSGCCKTLPVNSPAPDVADELHCFSVKMKGGATGVACSDNPKLCTEALAKATAYGDMAGIAEVGECHAADVTVRVTDVEMAEDP